MGKTTLLVLASMTLALLLACIAASTAAVPGFAQSATVTLVGGGGYRQVRRPRRRAHGQADKQHIEQSHPRRYATGP